MTMMLFVSFDSASALNPTFRSTHPRRTEQIRHSNESSLCQSSEIDESCEVCRRISSGDAAGLIRKQYSYRHANLLLITSDASGGSGRFHGLCAVLRLLNGHDDSQDAVSIAARRTRAVRQCTGKRKSRSRRASRDRKIGSGRVLGFPPEIAAVSLGLRTALNEISAEHRSDILLLVDCERTIAYLCDGLYEDNDPISRALQSLSGATKSNCIFVASVSSVSKLRFDGFFDHASADYIAGLVRGRRNTDASTLFYDGENPIKCMRLRDTDLEWLGLSEDEIEKENLSSGSLARDREEGRVRIDRLTERISVDYAANPLIRIN